jgi:hypothetical protein
MHRTVSFDHKLTHEQSFVEKSSLVKDYSKEFPAFDFSGGSSQEKQEDKIQPVARCKHEED